MPSTSTLARLGEFVLGAPMATNAPLATGARGQIWGGHHATQGTPVVIKLGTALSAQARAAAALHHVGVVEILDSGNVSLETALATRGALLEGSPYVVMERLSGGSLKDRPPSTFFELRPILKQLLCVLGHVHANGVLHLGLKPGNVLRTLTGLVKLTDFGLESVFWAAEYSAPEQRGAHERDHGPWTDLYALGCLAWTFTCGRPPRGRPPFIPIFEVPVGFEAFLNRLLHDCPGHRFQRAADALAALEILDDLGPRQVSAFGGVEALTSSFEAPVGAENIWAVGPTLSSSFAAVEHRPEYRGEAAVDGFSGLRPADFGRAELEARLRAISPEPFDLESERGLLWEAFSLVIDSGQGSLSLLRGRASTSGLAAWLGVLAHETGAATVLRVKHEATTGLTEPLASCFRRHLRSDGLDARGTADRLRGSSASSFSDARLDADQLAAFISGDDDEASNDRHRVYADYLRALGVERPVLLILEDVREGDDALVFAASLVELAPPFPIFCLATLRHEGPSPPSVVGQHAPSTSGRSQPKLRDPSGLAT